jgi:hypothetical protein|tara:strand:- start:640 stop:831 length:192 start_codon:yes stop_codon:yes gene_type:complete
MNKSIKIYLIKKYFKLINKLELKNLSKKPVKQIDDIIEKYNIPIYLYDLNQDAFILNSIKSNC